MFFRHQCPCCKKHLSTGVNPLPFPSPFAFLAMFLPFPTLPACCYQRYCCFRLQISEEQVATAGAKVNGPEAAADKSLTMSPGLIPGPSTSFTPSRCAPTTPVQGNGGENPWDCVGAASSESFVRRKRVDSLATRDWSSSVGATQRAAHGPRVFTCVYPCRLF